MEVPERLRKPLLYPTELRGRRGNCSALTGRLEGERRPALQFYYPQHPPTKTCRCRCAFQQEGQSWTVEWVKPSTDSILCSTITPQSEQGPVMTDRELCSWTGIRHHLGIWTNPSITHCRHECLFWLGSHQAPQAFGEGRSFRLL